MNERNGKIYTHVGARCLDKEIIKSMIPNITDLKHLVEEFRENAKKKRRADSTFIDDKKMNHFYYEKYDNFISILGNRGLGKTSTLMSIIREVENHTFFSDDTNNLYANDIYQWDLISPLIVPDDMGETSDILGWIIVILRKMYDEQIINCKKNREYEFLLNDSIAKLRIRIEELFQILEKNYQFRKIDYQNIITKYYDDSTSYIKKNIEIQKQDFEITNIFHELIDTLIELKKIVNGSMYNKIEPLIFFFFDDVDTTAKYCTNILEQLLIFLSHPNIVVFISGDYDLFSQSVTLKMLKDENLENRSIMESYVYGDEDKSHTAIELATSRSEFFLKKVLPPLYRYEIRLLDNKQKNNLTYGKINDNESLNKTIFDFLDEICYDNFEENDDNNKFYIINGKYIYVYLSVLSSNARGCMNVYLFLNRQLGYKNNGPQWNKVKFIDKFMEVLIDSKETYRKRIKDINKYIYIKNLEEKDEYKMVKIDCEELKFVIERILSKQKNNKPLDETVKKEVEALLFLAILINELLYCFWKNEYKYRYERISRKLQLILINVLCKSFNSRIKQFIPFGDSIKDSLYIYSCLTSRMSMTAIYQILNLNALTQNSPLNDNNDKKYFVQLMKTISDICTIKLRNNAKMNEKNIKYKNLIDDEKRNYLKEKELNRQTYDNLCYGEKNHERNKAERRLLQELIRRYKDTDYNWLLELKNLAQESLTRVHKLYPYNKYISDYYYRESKICEKYIRLLNNSSKQKKLLSSLKKTNLYLNDFSPVFSLENVRECYTNENKRKDYYNLLFFIIGDYLRKNKIKIDEGHNQMQKKESHDQLSNLISPFKKSLHSNMNNMQNTVESRKKLFLDNVEKCFKEIFNGNFVDLYENISNLLACDDQWKMFINKFYHLVKNMYITEKNEINLIINNRLISIQELSK